MLSEVEKEVNRVVMYSGGIGSWMAGKRVAEKYGTKNLYLLFTDTMMEDEDLYRFLEEGAKNIGGKLVRIADGRTPFEVFKDRKFMGNSRVDTCSETLKRKLGDKWLRDNFDPCNTIVYVGIDWSEVHRFDRLAPRKLPWVYRAPMTEAPYMSKQQMLAALHSEGIAPPRLYGMGFGHNNCGGFCVKAGQAHFRLLFQAMPERYLKMEAEEEAVYKAIGSKHPFLKKTENKVTRYITMREFREEYLEADKDIDTEDWGGCGCFMDDSEQDK